MFKLLRDFRVLSYLFFLALFIIFILPNPFAKGVVVKSVATDSPFFGKVQPGETITWANEKEIEAPEDFYAFENFTGVLRLLHDGKLELGNVDNYIGITLSAAPKSKINFGIDIIGGTRVLLEIKENVSQDIVEQAIATLETRINIYGLREAKIQSVSAESEKLIQIEMAGGSREEIEALLAKQGKFEAKIPKFVKLENSSGTLMVNGKNYSVSAENSKISVLGKIIDINESFILEDIEFEFVNSTNSTVTLLGNAFESKDVKSVCMQDQPGVCRSFVRFDGKGYEFVFQVTISKEGAERFAKLTKDMKVVFSDGRYVLENGFIILYLDNRTITELSIDKGLKGKAETQPSVTGFRSAKEDAIKEKLLLQSVLQSGALPVSLELAKVDEVSASLGAGFLNEIVLAGVIATAAVFSIIFIRYRKLKLAIPMIFMVISEAVMILGTAALIGWTIDLSAIAGMIAVVGTGIDDQIMIIDELLLGKERAYTIKQKIKRAFSIIFSSASTIAVAMLPLMFLGTGIMRGFAITTLIGLAIGIFITRPAFGRIAEHIMEKEQMSK